MRAYFRYLTTRLIWWLTSSIYNLILHPRIFFKMENPNVERFKIMPQESEFEGFELLAIYRRRIIAFIWGIIWYLTTRLIYWLTSWIYNLILPPRNFLKMENPNIERFKMLPQESEFRGFELLAIYRRWKIAYIWGLISDISLLD